MSFAQKVSFPLSRVMKTRWAICEPAAGRIVEMAWLREQLGCFVWGQINSKVDGLFVNNKSRRSAALAQRSLPRLNPSFVGDFRFWDYLCFVTVSHLRLCSRRKTFSYQKTFLLRLRLRLRSRSSRANCLRSRDSIHPLAWMSVWMERKSCEIKLALFSHQKQQHVMMIITRPLLDLLLRLLLVMEKYFCVFARERRGRAGEEISYSQLFAHNAERSASDWEEVTKCLPETTLRWVNLITKTLSCLPALRVNIPNESPLLETHSLAGVRNHIHKCY